MYNEEQKGHMRYLASLPKEEKCDCGWYKRGECFSSCYKFKEKGGAPKTTYYCPRHKTYVKSEILFRRKPVCQLWVYGENKICDTEVIIKKEWESHD